MVHRTFPLSTLLPFIGLLLLFACHDMDSGLKEITKSNSTVISRSECDPCGDDCCCGVELFDDTNAILQICGTTSGGMTCVTVSGGCTGDIDGTLENVLLNNSNPKHVFCMAGNSAIRIVNLSLSDNAKIRIGCNTVDYDALEFDIPAQDSIKVEVNSTANCEMTDCS